MMLSKLHSRRDFLKYAMFATSALFTQAFKPYFGNEDEQFTNNLVRVCSDTLSVYSEPSDKSKILYQRTRDEIINIYDEVVSEEGPSYNPTLVPGLGRIYA